MKSNLPIFIDLLIDKLTDFNRFLSIDYSGQRLMMKLDWPWNKFPKDIWKEPGTTFLVQFQYFSIVFYSKAVAKQSNIIVQEKIVVFLDFHSTKQGLPLVDFWSHGLN